MKNGKLKLKLIRNFIRKNKYQVLIDDVLIGELDYKNLKLDFETTVGKHKIIIKDEDCEIENHFYLSPQKIILPITISENFFWSKSNKFFSSIYLKSFVLGFVIVYFVIMIYLFYRNKDEVNLSFMIPLLLLLIFNTFKSTGKKVSIKIN